MVHNFFLLQILDEAEEETPKPQPAALAPGLEDEYSSWLLVGDHGTGVILQRLLLTCPFLFLAYALYIFGC